TVHHAVVDLFGHIEDGVEIGPHHRVPIILPHLAERHVLGDAGVVDEDVDRSDFGHDPASARLAGFEIGDVAGICLELKSFLLHVGDPLRGCLVRWRKGDSDAIAGIGHLRADGLAETAHTPGYERHTLGHFVSSLDACSNPQSPRTTPAVAFLPYHSVAPAWYGRKVLRVKFPGAVSAAAGC